MARAKIERTTGFVESGPERIYFEVHGAGDALVLSHGAGGNHAVWFQQVPIFAREYRVITWDQRGFGRSSNTAGQASPSAAVEDLARLLEHLGIDETHLVGQSMGGWAVNGFALAHPARVRSLVLADTLGGIYTAVAERAFDEFLRGLAGATPPDKLPLGVHPALGEGLVENDPSLGFLYQQLSSLCEPPPAQAAALLRGTAYEPGALAALTMPVLFVVGSDDPIFPPAAIRSAAELLPRSRVVEIPGTGHSPYFERAAQWNHVVGSFLAGYRRA